ncbi:MAG: M16 family metallopeptidase [Bacillota bacterium]
MPKHKKVILSNKMPVILVPLPGAKTTTALVMVRTGSKYESKKESGLSHFLEHMFFKGTKRRPDTFTLTAELDALGGEYNAFTSKEYTGFYVKAVAGKLAACLDILGDMLSSSKFEEAEVEREKRVVIEELKMCQDDPKILLEDVLEGCLYGDTPAGWDVGGTKNSVRGLKRNDIVGYFKRQYGANSMVVILAGAVKESDRTMIARTFSSFPSNPWKDKVAVVEKQSQPKAKIVKKDLDQINLSLAVRTFPAEHPMELALKVMGVILGGSMSSRLFISLRERSGLAYHVYTRTEHYTDSGYLATTAGVPKGKTGAAIAIIMQEYQRIMNEEVPASELERAKDLLSGHMVMHQESSDDVASWYGQQAMIKNKLIDPEEQEKRLRAVTSADIRRAALAVMKDANLNLAVIGQIKKEEEASIKKVLRFNA